MGGEIPVDRQTLAWLEAQAGEHHGGDVGACVAAILRGVREAAAEQADPWAALVARARVNRWPPYRIPVKHLVEFVEWWEQRADGHTAADVLASMRESMTRRDGDLELPPGT